MIGAVSPAELWPRVNAARIDLGLSGEQLARILGCTPGELWRWSVGAGACALTLLAAERWIELGAPRQPAMPCHWCRGRGVEARLCATCDGRMVAPCCDCVDPDPDRCAGVGVTPPPREAWEGPAEAPCDCGCHR